MKHVVLLSNRRKLAVELDAEFPSRVGCLFAPVDRRDPKHLYYALDNGKFAVWDKGKRWERQLFLSMVEYFSAFTNRPKWIAVPDVVADAEGTLRSWDRWFPRLSQTGWPLALVVQDGMTPAWVRNNIEPQPDVVFVGGSTNWKWRTVETWCSAFPKTHVGRVNTGGKLWRCHEAGTMSSDGTGWWHHGQLKQLKRYLQRSAVGLSRRNIPGFLA